MGKCHTKINSSSHHDRSNTKSSTFKQDNLHLIENVYGIKMFNSPVKPSHDLTSPLKFEYKLSNFKARGLMPNRHYILKVIFAEREFILPLVSGVNPKFNFEEHVKLEIIYDKLEETYLEILMYSLSNEIDIFKNGKLEDLLKKSSFYSGLKVDFLTIAIGPEHHDLILKEPRKRDSKHLGRINFNVTCNHIENVKLDIKYLKFKLPHLVQHDIAMKLKFRDSQHQIDTLYTNNIVPQIIHKEETTNYEWKTSEMIDPDSPKLQIESKLSMLELRSSDAAICIYSIRLVDIKDATNDRNNNFTIGNENSKNPQQGARISMLRYRHSDTKFGRGSTIALPEDENIELVQKYSFIGYSNLNFYKILTVNDNAIVKQSSKFFQNYSTLKNTNTPGHPIKGEGMLKEDVIKFQVFDNINQTFVEDVQSNGEVIGSLEGVISIYNLPLIRQIMCGVHTERGFDINSIHLNMEYRLNTNFEATNKETEPVELILLQTYKNNLESEISNHTQLKTKTQSEKEFNVQMLKIMNNIKTVLQKTCKESCLYYDYKNNRDLYKAQKIMIELGLYMIDMIEKVNLDQRTIGFEILKLINDRAEFDLGTLHRSWFDDHSHQHIVFRENDLVSMKIVEHFLMFNNDCLRFTLDRLARGKNIDKESKKFVEFFLSLAYFRIPKFRQCFIEVISHDIKEEGKLAYEKGLASIDDFINLDPVNSLILWENLFYKRLDSALHNTKIENDIGEKLKETDDIVNQSDAYVFGGRHEWRNRLAKRDIVFFSMIHRLEKYISYKIVKVVDIKWFNIPGFDKIMYAIMHEIKQREVRLYPNQLMELLSIFINDSTIINTFVKEIVYKTNVYDVNAVFNVVKILDMLFKEHEKKKQVSDFVNKFDYNLLKFSIKATLDIDHSLSVGHLGEVFSQVFFRSCYKLFFHWSWQVRNIFYYFIVFVVGFRLKKMDFRNNREERGMRRNSISDGNEIENYAEEIQRSIMTEFDEKMKIIPLVRDIIREEHLDPTYNTNFSPNDNEELNKIPRDLYKNVVISMHHYESVEKDFKDWEFKNRRKPYSQYEYPDIPLTPPKDDVVEYYSDSW